MSTFLSAYAVQNWAITPVATAIGQAAPKTVHDQLFQLVLSGVVFANQVGASNGNWGYNTVSFDPDVSAPLNWAIATYGIAKPTGNYNIEFSVQQYAPLVTINSIFDAATAINAGWAADAFRPTAFGTGTDVTTHAAIGGIFNGMDVDLAVRDTDAWLYRLGYTITLIGKVVFPTAPIIE